MPRAVPLELVACLVLASSCGGTGARPSAPAAAASSLEAPRTFVPLAAGVEPVAEEVELWLDTRDHARFKGRVALQIDVKEPTSRLRFHGEAIDVHGVRVEVGERKLAARIAIVGASGALELQLDETLRPGPVLVRMVYEGRYQSGNEGLRIAERDGTWLAAASFEPFGARRAFPCFDEPRFKIPFTVRIVTTGADEAVSNGLLQQRTPLQGGFVRHAFAPTEPLAPYQVAIAAGRYDVVPGAAVPPSALRGWEIPVRGLAGPGAGRRYPLVRSVAPAVLWLEGLVGLPFPLKKLDLVEAPALAAGLAMESPGAILFRTRADVAEGPELGGARAILAHELAHQWFGNAMTPATWDDLWLSEGIATYFEEAYVDAEKIPLFDGYAALLRRWYPWRPLRVGEPLGTLSAIASAFDERAYGKPAGILASLALHLGPARTRALWGAFQRRAKGGLATRAQFFEAVAEVADDETARSFQRVLFADETPLLRVQLTDTTPPALRFRIEPDFGVPPADDAESRVPVCVRAHGPKAAPPPRCELRPWGESVLDAPWAEGASSVLGHVGAGDATALVLGTDETRRLLPVVTSALAPRERIAFGDGLLLGLEAHVLGAPVFFDAVAALAKDAEGIDALRNVTVMARQALAWAPASPARTAAYGALSRAVAGALAARPAADAGSAPFARTWALTPLFFDEASMKRALFDGGEPAEAKLPAWAEGALRPVLTIAARVVLGDESAVGDALALHARAPDETIALAALAAMPARFVADGLDRISGAGLGEAVAYVTLSLLLERQDTRAEAFAWWLQKSAGARPEAWPGAVRAALLNTCDPALLEAAVKRFGATVMGEDAASARVQKVRLERCADRRRRLLTGLGVSL